MPGYMPYKTGRFSCTEYIMEMLLIKDSVPIIQSVHLFKQAGSVHESWDSIINISHDAVCNREHSLL